MPSQLTQAVRTALSSFVSSQESDGDHVAADILRTVKEEAANMLERQMILDTFDSDPFKLCEDDTAMRNKIRRVKSLIDVTSFSRCVTKEGYARIDAVVCLKNDPMMRGVNDHLKLTFSYERMLLSLSSGEKGGDSTVCFDSEENTEEISTDSSSAGMSEEGKSGKRKERPNIPRRKKRMNISEREKRSTHVTYSIDLSKDHGMKERLLFVEVFGAGEVPSPKEALPMDDGSESVWKDFERENDSKDLVDGQMEESDDADGSSSGLNKADSSGDDETDDRDRFGAYVDPDVILKFLKWTKLEFDEASSVFFLLTFPFYEHEWDLAGFVLDSVFGEEIESTSGSS